jgi:hypothetical protein
VASWCQPRSTRAQCSRLAEISRQTSVNASKPQNTCRKSTTHQSALAAYQGCGTRMHRKSALRPNPSLKLTRYGMQRKHVVRRLRHLRTPGLHCTPPRTA